MVDRNAVRRAYDDVSETYAAKRSENGNGRGAKILTEFLDSLSDPSSVLDAGCGQGTPVLEELSASTAAFGVDFSREQLRLAAANVPDAALVQGDMTTLPFDDAAFDAVVAYWSLIHVPMDDHQAVIDEFARVLRPGGRILLCEGTNEWIGENPDWLESGVTMAWNIAGAETTRDQLQSAGFAIEDKWGAPEVLEGNDEREQEQEQAQDDADHEDEDDDDDFPWTFFAARLET